MHRTLTTLVAVVLIVAGCGSNEPSASPGSATPAASSPATSPTASARPEVEVYAEIRAAVIAIRGLEPKAAVDPVVVDEDKMVADLAAEFDATYTEQQLKDTEDLLITLGLLPAGASLRQLNLDFKAGQVAGYYSPEKDELFVVSGSGGIGPVEEATYAHEFTHQLQDQNIDLDALGLDSNDQSDRSLGRLAMVEGDATSVQSSWMTANLNSDELGELLAAGLDPAALAAFNNAPRYLQDTSLFPYQGGLAFVTRLLTSGGYAAVNAAFADPPDSTEQILHPDKYLVRERPVQITIPAGIAARIGAGWTAAGQDTLGELILRTWLREGGVTAADAREAAAGWGGDRLVLLRGPDGALSVALLTAWDTAADADAFAAAVRTALPILPGGGTFDHAPGSKSVSIAIGDDAARVLAAASD